VDGKVPNGVEKLPKISTGWVGCTSVTDRQTDRQTTDGRTGDRLRFDKVTEFKGGCPPPPSLATQTWAENWEAVPDAVIHSSVVSMFFITFCVSRKRHKMYCGHARLCVCLSVCLSVCVSVRGRTPTLLHGPGCNLAAW